MKNTPNRRIMQTYDLYHLKHLFENEMDNRFDRFGFDTDETC